MKNKRKYNFKNIMIFAVAAAFSIQLVGCSASQEQETFGCRQEAEHLLAVWSDYIGALDKMYASELWAMDYADNYLESGNWADLTKARTACIASARYLTELSMTEEDLSEEEYLALANAGIDTGYQKADISSITDSLEEAHGFIRDRLLEGLECDVFYKGSIDILKEEVKVQRDCISCMCKYACYETNYLLVTLGDDVVPEDYWSSMQEKYPALSTGRAEWLDAEGELRLATDQCLDEYEDTILRQSDLISMMNADLYEMKQIVENNDLEALLASASTMSDLPELLPMPIWYDAEKTGYLSVILEEDGSVAYPESGDDLTDADYGMYIQVEDVSEEEIAAYMELAENYAQYTWKKEDGAVQNNVSRHYSARMGIGCNAQRHVRSMSTWYIMMPDYNVKIEWEDNHATILFNGEDITFAPIWYIWLWQEE